MSSDLREAALEYHRFPTPGKISVTPTKPMVTQRDLALAYSPGVAAACEAIVADPAGRRLHRARQSGRGHHQRHRRARPGQHRPAGRQAGDGGQGRACSRNSPASTCSTSSSPRTIRTS